MTQLRDRDFYLTFITVDGRCTVEGTIEDFFDYTFDDTAETEYDEPFTKEEKLEFLDNLIEDIKAYKLKITNEAEQEE